MANQVYANSREVSCKAAAGKTIGAFPDVCMTPPQTPATPPGVPIPYPNTAMASDCTDGSSTVQISGQEVMLKNSSFFKTSTGDEAGSAPLKGVITATNKGKAYFTSWSSDVKIEGEAAVRHLDLTTHNHASEPGATPPTPYGDASASDSSAGAKPCVIMIGENQKRVNKAAEQAGAKTITLDWPKDLFFKPYVKEIHEPISLEFNRQWINQKMDEGCTILDLGPTDPSNNSAFYKMEREEIAKRGYPRLAIKMKAPL